MPGQVTGGTQRHSLTVAVSRPWRDLKGSAAPGLPGRQKDTRTMRGCQIIVLAGAIGVPIQVAGAELSIMASLGIDERDENTPDMDTLLARADQATYIAKYLGRNRVARSK